MSRGSRTHAIPRYRGIMPAFVYPPNGISETFMRAMHNSYKAGVFQHDYVANVGSRPNYARTLNGQTFLGSDAEWIFLIDTDMAWQPEDIITLRQFAERRGVKMVSGWAAALRNGIWPNAYRYEGDGFVPWGEIEPHSAPLQVDGVGGACVLVHRDIYEEVAAHTIDTTQYLWQDDVYIPSLGYQMGEDLVFSDRVNKFTNHKIWYHPAAIFVHIKGTPYGGKEYLRFVEGLRRRAYANIHTANVQPTDQQPSG